MASNWNRVSDEDLAYIEKCLKAGESASQIAAKMPGRTRNGILGIIDRHLKPVKRVKRVKGAGDGRTRAEREEPANLRSAAFAEPSPPRRFSFQDLPA